MNRRRRPCKRPAVSVWLCVCPSHVRGCVDSTPKWNQTSCVSSAPGPSVCVLRRAGLRRDAPRECLYLDLRVRFASAAIRGRVSSGTTPSSLAAAPARKRSTGGQFHVGKRRRRSFLRPRRDRRRGAKGSAAFRLRRARDSQAHQDTIARTSAKHTDEKRILCPGWAWDANRPIRESNTRALERDACSRALRAMRSEVDEARRRSDGGGTRSLEDDDGDGEAAFARRVIKMRMGPAAWRAIARGIVGYEAQGGNPHGQGPTRDRTHRDVENMSSVSHALEPSPRTHACATGD